MSKYAREENERRFLLPEAPASAQVLLVRDIEDWYIRDSTLRLRKVTTGTDTVYKFGQKVRRAADDPARLWLTNLYITEDEYRLLRELPGALVRKQRSLAVVGRHRVGIDRFAGDLNGLVLAESALDAPDPGGLATALGAVADVTHENRFSGGALAQTSPTELAALLRVYGLTASGPQA